MTRIVVDPARQIGTARAARRAENGHPEPYRVRYWGLGHEM